MPEQSLRILWVGFHEEGLPTFRALAEGKHKPIAALTLNERRLATRSGAVRFEDVCAEYEIPLHKIGSINASSALELIQSLKPDLLVVLGWSQILREEVLSIPKIGTLGAHASCLPHNRGSAPVNWAIIRGETQGGNTLMWLNPGVDTGEIIAQRAFPIALTDTCGSVYAKVAESNREMVLELLQELEAGRRPGHPQPESNEDLLPRRTPEEGVLDWTKSALETYNFIRALARPYPGAFTHLGQKMVLCWKAAWLDGVSADQAPGTILGSSWSPETQACGLLVQCGTGVLLLLELEYEGQLLSGADLLDLDWKGATFAAQP